MPQLVSAPFFHYLETKCFKTKRIAGKSIVSTSYLLLSLQCSQLNFLEAPCRVVKSPRLPEVFVYWFAVSIPNFHPMRCIDAGTSCGINCFTQR